MPSLLRRTLTVLLGAATLLAAAVPLQGQAPTFTGAVRNRSAEPKQDIHQQFPAADRTGVTYAMANLPPGLAFDAARRIVTGAPKKTGTWTATYTATDGSGRKATAAPVFTISASGSARMEIGGEPSNAQIIQPVDALQTPAITVDAGQAVTFEGVSDGGKTPMWNFGDGTSLSFGFGPLAHTFATAGTYTVTFSVAPDVTYAPSSATLTVNVQGAMPPPTITAFGASPTSLLFGQSTTLTWTVANATSLSLSPGGTVTGTSTTRTPTATTGYQLSATNGSGTTSSAVVTVTVATVSVTLTPKPSTVAPGSATVFSASVGGAVSTGLTWSASGGSLSATTGSSVTWTAPASGGPFTVTARSAADTSKSDSATVGLASGTAPTITAQPDAQAVTEGQPATFSVAATGTAPLAFQWRKNGAALPGATSSTYTTPATTGADNGSTFSVVVSNAYGSATSAEAPLTVVAANAPPVITRQPRSQSVTEGQRATFTVGATGTGPLAYQWKRGGNALAGATASSYATPPTALGDSGAVYSVEVSNPYGSVSSTGAALTVTAAVAPTITAQPQAQTVEEGRSATFSVTATGSAPLAYQWWKNGAAIAGATGSSYGTPAAKVADSGSRYSVVVSNGGGSATSEDAALTVTPSQAPVIVVQPVAQTASLGDPATFAVTASGAGTLTYLWFKNNLPLTAAGSVSAYTTPPVTSAMNGASYKVVVANGSGSVTSVSVTLTVAPYGQMVWKKDLVYLGTKEVAEVDPSGLVHTTLVDHLGSPRLVVNSTGTVEAEQKYLPFGELLDQTGSLKTIKGYTNHEQTDPSGLIYMQARFYAPMYHRFLSPDPKQDEHFQDTQGWNIYSYCENSPVLRWDPDGMDWIDDALIGAYKGLSKVPVVGATMRLTAAATNQTVDSDGVKAVGDAKTRWTQAGSATLQLASDSAQVLSGGGMAATVKNIALDTAVGVAEGAASGEFRGGAHSQTSKPAGDGLESHHTPAKGTTGLSDGAGPAIQMDPTDHAKTSSHARNGAAGAAWRAEAAKDMKGGTASARSAMAREVRDVRRVAREAGDGRKYNKALQGMLKYAKKVLDIVK